MKSLQSIADLAERAAVLLRGARSTLLAVVPQEIADDPVFQACLDKKIAQCRSCSVWCRTSSLSTEDLCDYCTMNTDDTK